MEALLNQQVKPLFAELAEQGLMLATVINVQQLSDAVWLADGARKDRGSLLLLGHGGRTFWQNYQQSKPVSPDPVDHFSAAISEQALQEYLPTINHEILFPNAECPVNLMALGREIGWHSPSPLGMGINTEYGMWSAYRALWWFDAEIAVVDLPVARDICAECLTQECLQACPADALSLGAMPNLEQCADYRLQPESDCKATCVARLACPVAEEHRYTREQMAYHYDLERSQIHLFSSKHKSKGQNHG